MWGKKFTGPGDEDLTIFGRPLFCLTLPAGMVVQCSLLLFVTLKLPGGFPTSLACTQLRIPIVKPVWFYSGENFWSQKTQENVFFFYLYPPLISFFAYCSCPSCHAALSASNLYRSSVGSERLDVRVRLSCLVIYFVLLFSHSPHSTSFCTSFRCTA